MGQDAHADLVGLHILVLAEDGNAYLSLKRQFSDLGAAAISRAQSPDEALDMLRASSIDVLVTDLCLPFIKYLRTSGKSPNQAIPIIVSSDCQEARMIRAARDAGIDAFITRAAKPNQVGRHIREAVRRERAFITARNFAGPDRRHHDSLDYHGVERRGLAGVKARLARLDRYYPAGTVSAQAAG